MISIVLLGSYIFAFIFLPQRETHCDQSYYNKGINQGPLGGDGGVCGWGRGAERLFAWRQLTAPVNVFAGASARVLLLEKEEEEEFRVAPQGDGERCGRYA